MLRARCARHQWRIERVRSTQPLDGAVASQGDSRTSNGAGDLESPAEAGRRCPDLPRSSTSIALGFEEELRPGNAWLRGT